MQLQNIFVHHVFFYLNESDEANTQNLVEGLQKLAKHLSLNNRILAFLQIRQEML